MPFAKLNGWIFDLLGGTYIIIEDDSLQSKGGQAATFI
jgi:hypothetical protein